MLSLMIAAGTARAAETPSPPSAETPKAPKDHNLIVDYLPNALYVGDRLTACFRIENTTKAKTDATVTFEFLNDKGDRVRDDRADGECPPSGYWSYQRSHSLSGVASIKYVLQVGGKEQDRGSIRLVYPNDPFPKAKGKDGRLWDEKAETQFVFLVQPRLRKEDRRWAPVRWVLGSDDRRTAPKAPALFAPRMAAAGEAGKASSFLAQIEGRDKVAVVELEPPEVKGPEPIFGAVCRICGAVDAAKSKQLPDRAVVLLPPEDVEWSTGLREYRLAIELLLSRMELAGVAQVALAPPLHFSAPRKRTQLYRDLVRELTVTYAQAFVDDEALLADEFWRVSDDASRVFGRHLNAKGSKRLAEEIGKALK